MSKHMAISTKLEFQLEVSRAAYDKYSQTQPWEPQRTARTLLLETSGKELQWRLTYEARAHYADIGAAGSECQVQFRLDATYGTTFMTSLSYEFLIASEKCGWGVGYHEGPGPLRLGIEYKGCVRTDGPIGKEVFCSLEILLEKPSQERQDRLLPSDNDPVQAIKDLFGRDDHSDIRLECGQVSIPAHKAVLAVHSETFATVFASNRFVEAQSGVYTIKEEHMRPQILTIVLEWMYLRGVPRLELDDMSQLLEAAEYLEIWALKDHCYRVLVGSLSPASCLKCLDLGFKYGHKELKAAASRLLMDNPTAVLRFVSSKEDLEALTTNIPNIFKEFFSLDSETWDKAFYGANSQPSNESLRKLMSLPPFLRK